MYRIEPILIIFPAAVGLLSLKFRRNLLVCALIYLSFVFLFVFSELGPDYLAYQTIYTDIAEGVPFSEIHGEKLFLYTMQLFIRMGFGYKMFRVAFLSTSLFVFCYFTLKFTDNFALSFLLLFLGFIVYTVSAYRQFMAMAFIIASLYFLIVKDKKLVSLISAVIATLWHTSGVVMAAFWVFYIITNEIKDKNRSLLANIYDFITKNIFFMIFLAMAIRLFLYEIIDFYDLNLVGNLSYKDISRTSFGFLSRATILIVVSSALKKTKYDPKIAGLYMFYGVSLLLYIVFPYELLMGRLTNNARVLDVLLVPMIFYSIKEKQPTLVNIGNTFRRNYAYNFLAMVLIVYSAMFIYQLLAQSGYTPYIPYWR